MMYIGLVKKYYLNGGPTLKLRDCIVYWGKLNKKRAELGKQLASSVELSSEIAYEAKSFPSK
jgi:hypothetical protein